ncbi:MAG TPA: head GIN domain-containing protein [Actinomycetota bacterium]|jgi:hypothetical protein|nr:head GIN domain-containing protein [Actinomycetota bacterium]
MERKRRNVLACLLAGLVLPSCTLISGSDSEPTPGATASGSTSSSSSSSSSSSGSGENVTGSGNLKSEERPVSGFDRVSIQGIGDLQIEQSGEESLTIEAEDNLLPLLVSEVEGGRLKLGIRPNSSISATKPIVYRLKVKTLNGIDGSGSVTIDAVGLDADRLEVGLSGTVKSVLAGRATAQIVTISGAGGFDGRALTGRTAEVEVSGTGRAVVNVSDELRARASGASSIGYLGGPEVDQQTSGVARVEKTA